MTGHTYTKDQLVEQPAIGVFAEYSAGPNPHPRSFSYWEKGGRQARLGVRSLVLVSRLRAALGRLNPALPPEAITTAVDEWTRDLARPPLLSRQRALAGRGMGRATWSLIMFTKQAMFTAT